MKPYLSLLILITAFSCQKESPVLRDNLSIELSTYQDSSQTKAAAMPALKAGSELLAYKSRFDYLLLNIPEIHHPDRFRQRDSINALYPDTLRIKRLYLDNYCQDQKLVQYFEEAYAPIHDPAMHRDKVYTADELMEVASRFFYCDQVNPDTTIQVHVCIGINGTGEAGWTKDYTLLEAFCYEAIFNDLDKEDSQLSTAYLSEKKASGLQFRKTITTLDRYLADVKHDLFKRMKHNAVLKEKLLAYYEANKSNLAFGVMK